MEQNDAVIKSILERNARVELDKAWETSWTRRITIFMLTYGVSCVLLWSLRAPLFTLQALLPAAGYLLSTFSLPWIKRQWIRRR